MYIYADNAGTTKMSPVAIDAMTKCMNEVFGNPSSLHSTGQRAAEVLQKAREDVAEALGADFNEIYFTSGGSEADNQAIRSAALFGAKKGKKHLISTKIEHHAVLVVQCQNAVHGALLTLRRTPAPRGGAWLRESRRRDTRQSGFRCPRNFP